MGLWILQLRNAYWVSNGKTTKTACKMDSWLYKMESDPVYEITTPWCESLRKSIPPFKETRFLNINDLEHICPPSFT